MHNVISSCFFPSGELCWAEGGGWLYVGGGVGCWIWWWWGVCSWCRGYFVFVFFCLTFCFPQFLTLFDFFLMLSIYFADCVAAVWSHASGIFGVWAVRYFYWEIKKEERGRERERIHADLCVQAHTSICVCVYACVSEACWWVFRSSSGSCFITSLPYSWGLCYVNAGEKLADSKCFLFTRR